MAYTRRTQSGDWSIFRLNSAGLAGNRWPKTWTCPLRLCGGRSIFRFNSGWICGESLAENMDLPPSPFEKLGLNFSSCPLHDLLEPVKLTICIHAHSCSQ